MDQSYGSKVESNDLEFALRSFLIKLSVAEPLTKALPPGNFEILAFSFFSQFTFLSPMMEKSGDSQLKLKSATTAECRWEITAYFRSLPPGSSKEAQLWIPTDTKHWQQPPLITPIKSISSEPLSVQLYLEHPSLSEPTAPAV